MDKIEAILNYSHRLYQFGFLAATDGNVSARDEEGNIIITRSGVCKGDLKKEDLLVTDLQGRLLRGSGKLSTETLMHLTIYENRPDINAVVHAHPVSVNAAVLSGTDLDKPYFPEVILTLGRIPVCRYATPSTPDLSKSLMPYIEYASVFLLENHGAVATGKNVKEAYFRMERLEHYARTILAASVGGRWHKTLPPDKLRELYEISGSTYGITLHPKNKYA
ncbi:MAG: class II aldolase/adducin family protein [Ignavibacteriaceae bacterium]|nr:class II aldolase/adducin family protein [Ignavibacteriaceae bacterium]